MTEQTNRDREFFQLVVEKETTRCWSWLGDHDEDGRPVFRGDKAYRVMYRLRVDDVPERFHVHHKCENSACVNPRHLVALSPEAHRAVHATKDHALKERIYRGEWRRIKTEKALAEQLARERRERQWREQERLAEEQLREYERLAEEQRQRVAAIAAEEARKREERRKKRAVALRKLRIYGTPVLACELALYCVIKFHWLSEKPIGDLMEWFPKNAITALIALTILGVTLVFFIVVLVRRERLRGKCAVVLRELHLYGTPVLACGLLLYCAFEFDWFSQEPLASLANWFFKKPVPILWVLTLSLAWLCPIIVGTLMRRKKVLNRLRRFHIYGTPALVCGLFLYVGWQFDWFLNGTPSRLTQVVLCALLLIFSMLAIGE